MTSGPRPTARHGRGSPPDRGASGIGADVARAIVGAHLESVAVPGALDDAEPGHHRRAAAHADRIQRLHTRQPAHPVHRRDQRRHHVPRQPVAAGRGARRGRHGHPGLQPGDQPAVRVHRVRDVPAPAGGEPSSGGRRGGRADALRGEGRSGVAKALAARYPPRLPAAGKRSVCPQPRGEDACPWRKRAHGSLSRQVPSQASRDGAAGQATPHRRRGTALRPGSPGGCS